MGRYSYILALTQISWGNVRIEHSRQLVPTWSANVQHL